MSWRRVRREVAVAEAIVGEATLDARAIDIALGALAEYWDLTQRAASRLLHLITQAVGLEPARLAVDCEPFAIVALALARLYRPEDRECVESRIAGAEIHGAARAMPYVHAACQLVAR